MFRWIKLLLFAVWGLLLIPLIGMTLERWLAENIFFESSATGKLISDHLVAVNQQPWFRFALVFMTGMVIGISLETSAKRAGERRAFELRSLGYKFRGLAASLKERTISPGWPDNARDLKSAILSVLATARKYGFWTPGERVYDLPDASFLCEYFGSVGKLLEDGHPDDARREALSWKPFLDRAKAKLS
jgi:hypothetical protein